MGSAHTGPQLYRHLNRFRREYASLLVWLVAAGGVTLFLASRIRSHEFIGLAQALQYEVSAPIAGTVAEVLVKPLDRVEAGGVVARLDDRLLQAQVRTATATASQLDAQIDAERFKMSAGAGLLAEGYNADLRRFKMDEDQLGLQILSLEVTVESDEVEMERLRLETSRNQTLLEAGLIGEADLDNSRLSYERVAVRVNRNKTLLAEMRERHDGTRQRREDFESTHPASAGLGRVLQPLVEATKVQAARLEELRIQLRNQVLRAPVAGEVSQVLCRKGQAVTPGEAVVLIAEPIPTEVMAYLPESTASRVALNSRVLISRRGKPGRTAESFVARVGAAIEAIPPQLWRDSRTPEYGLAVAIATTPALKLTPGEVVFVRTVRDR